MARGRARRLDRPGDAAAIPVIPRRSTAAAPIANVLS
jgi:hypothetical protein